MYSVTHPPSKHHGKCEFHAERNVHLYMAQIHMSLEGRGAISQCLQRSRVERCRMVRTKFDDSVSSYDIDRPGVVPHAGHDSSSVCLPDAHRHCHYHMLNYRSYDHPKERAKHIAGYFAFDKSQVSIDRLLSLFSISVMMQTGTSLGPFQTLSLQVDIKAV